MILSHKAACRMSHISHIFLSKTRKLYLFFAWCIMHNNLSLFQRFYVAWIDLLCCKGVRLQIINDIIVNYPRNRENRMRFGKATWKRICTARTRRDEAERCRVTFRLRPRIWFNMMVDGRMRRALDAAVCLSECINIVGCTGNFRPATQLPLSPSSVYSSATCPLPSHWMYTLITCSTWRKRGRCSMIHFPNIPLHPMSMINVQIRNVSAVCC